MRRGLIVCVVAAVLIGAAPLVASAQTAQKRVGGHPNLNGLWQSMSTAYWNLEGHAASPLNDFWRLGSIGVAARNSAGTTARPWVTSRPQRICASLTRASSTASPAYWTGGIEESELL